VKRSSNILAGVLGGIVVAVVGAVLLATGVVETGGKTTTVVQRQAPLANAPRAADDERGDSGPLTVGQIAERTGPGVAFISADVVQQSANPFGFPDQQQGEATGSGFVLNKDGYIATNAHVVDGAKKVQVRFGEHNPTPAKIVGSDLSTDLAVIKVDPTKVKLTPIPLGESSKLHVGDPVVAIGNPFGFEDTVTTGIVSALQREITAPNDFSIDHAIQTDASINPGNSGGPLLDAQGRVIGINSQIATGGDNKGSVGIGFAIPIDTAKQVFPQLIKNGRVPHAYIGVTTAAVTPQVAQQLKLPADSGALIQAIEPGSPADKAGLRAGSGGGASGIATGGDLIVGVDGKKVIDPNDIATAIADDKPGDRVTIEVLRGKSRRTVSVTLVDRPEKAPGAAGGP
jgi:S1-C subfamily serine protease